MINFQKQAIRLFLLIIVWLLAIRFFIFIRFYQNENTLLIDNELINYKFLKQYANFLGFLCGVFFWILDYIFSKISFRKLSYGLVVLIQSIIYFSVYVFLIFGSAILVLLHNNVSFSISEAISDQMQASILVPIIYVFVVTFLLIFLKQVQLKFGPGNMTRLILGQFRNPRKQERFFMFIDLKGSTTIAEKLGAIHYSDFIKDCFIESSIATRYLAEIYQYVGDEIVLSWSKKNGLKNENCIQFYYDFTNRLRKKEAYFDKKYGIQPIFKAGVHFGEIIITEVGEIKREIAFHGDTINTTSRIQEQCNSLQENLLVSDTIQKLFLANSNFKFNRLCDLTLRGKENTVSLCAVEQCSVPKKK